MVPELQTPKVPIEDNPSEPTQAALGGFQRRWKGFKVGIFRTLRQLNFYFRHRAFVPSFAGAMLYFTVLSFAGQMVTYLLSVGYNSIHIGIARTVSVIFEISATWIAPMVMSRIGPVRAGIWFISWQMCCLAGAMSIFCVAASPVLAASGLVGGTILSRVGLWGFDLSTQVIIQEVCFPSILIQDLLINEVV